MAIMPFEKQADLQAIGTALTLKFQDFYTKTGRKIHLEMEPGKYLTINSCSMITEIQDIVDTGEEGYQFLKINSGMNDMPRVAMYGVQEPIFVIHNPQTSLTITSSQPSPFGEKEQVAVLLSCKEREQTSELKNYAVVGHCCESSDLLTCKLYEAETIETRELPEAHI